MLPFLHRVMVGFRAQQLKLLLKSDYLSYYFTSRHLFFPRLSRSTRSSFPVVQFYTVDYRHGWADRNKRQPLPFIF